MFRGFRDITSGCSSSQEGNSLKSFRTIISFSFSSGRRGSVRRKRSKKGDKIASG